MAKKRKNWIIYTIVAVVIVLLAVVVVKFVLFGGGPEVPHVETTLIARGDITASVSGEGELRAQNQVDISAETMATVNEIYIEEGEFVEKGALLCRLDDDTLVSERRLYQAQYNVAKAEYERGKILYDEGLSSKAEIDALYSSLEIARAQLDKSRIGLSETRIFAPISGQVIAVEVEEGETVVVGTMNNAGTILFTIADLSAMQAELLVDETDIVAVTSGQPARITLDAMPNIIYEGEVRTVGYTPSTSTADTVSSGVTEFEVVLDIKNPDKALRPGMTAYGDITTAKHEGVLICPLQAIGEHEVEGRNVETVYVVENDRVRLVPVVTGISDGSFIEIVDGIEEGQIIVSGPYDVLRSLNDGDTVKAGKPSEGKWTGKNENGKSGGDFVRGLGRMTRGRGR